MLDRSVTGPAWPVSFQSGPNVAVNYVFEAASKQLK